jgi:hypothetical protein
MYDSAGIGGGGILSATVGVASLPYTGDSSVLRTISIAAIALGTAAIMTGIVRLFAQRMNRN